MPDLNTAQASTGQLADNRSDAYRTDGTLLDPNNILTGPGRWTDRYARRIVIQEYDEAKQWRRTNHDWRWDEAEKLYLAWYPQATWPGSRMPKSSLGVPITFEQIESMKPRIVGGIFSDDQWFEAEGTRGCDPKTANAIQMELTDQLSFSIPKEVVRRAVNSGLLFGNGIIELYWDARVEAKLEYVPQYIPKRNRIVDPITGRWMSMPSGEMTFKMIEKEIEESINRPAIRNISIRDFYIDPHAPSVVCNEARYNTKRIMMTLDEIAALSDAQGFDVPSMAELINIINFGHDYEPADQSRQTGQAVRGVSINPSAEYTVDGRLARVEVLIRWSKERLVWVVGKALTIYNHPNPMPAGKLPFYNVFYSDLSDRFYGLSIADVVEGEQRFQQKLINHRLDELSLAIDPPTVTTANRLSTFELRYRPGNVAHVSDPGKDVQRQFPQNVTGQAFMEQQQSDIRVQRITGQNESIMQGVPTAQNPIGRSAAGANLQAQGSISRIIYIVENIETLCLEPIISDAWEMAKRFTDPQDMQDIAKTYSVDPAAMFNAKVKPHIRAGSKMLSKQAMTQAFPLIMQSIGNGQVMAELAQQGMTVDWVELFKVLFDATGYTRKVTIIRPMNQQEQQAYQQEQQAKQQGPIQGQMQLQKARLDQLSQMQQDKGTMDFVTQVAKIMLQNKAEGKPLEQGLGPLLSGMMPQNSSGQNQVQAPGIGGNMPISASPGVGMGGQ